MSDITPKEEEIIGAYKANNDLGGVMKEDKHLLGTDEAKGVLDTYEKAELIYKDHLTGLNNRRGFDEQLETMYAHAKRTGEILSIAFLDADKFKNINTKYGKQKGDEVLNGIADSMRSSFRSSDILARWGGDEFAAIMLNSFEEQPIDEDILSERLNNNLKNKFIPKGVDPSDVSVTVGMTLWDGSSSLKEFQKEVEDRTDSRK